MYTKHIIGEDGRKYIVTSETDLAEKVTKIDKGYIHINATLYESAQDNLCVKLVEPVPLSEVPVKDILLLPKEIK